MRILILTNLFFFISFQICKAQELTYTYPLSIHKFSKEVSLVELYSERMDNFDTLNINGNFELKSSPISERRMESGKIINIRNHQSDLEFSFFYDKKGNIQSRISNSKVGRSEIEYKLDQKEFKLETRIDGILTEEIYFDSLKRETLRIRHSKISSGKVEFRTIMDYEGPYLSSKKRYENDQLQNIENYIYKNGKLQSTRLSDSLDNTILEKTFIYSKGRVDIHHEYFRDDSLMIKKKI